MIVLHVVDVVHSIGSGVASVVPKYVEYQSKYITTALYDLNNKFNGLNIKVLNYMECNKISFLPSPYNKPDLVVFHEIYKIKYIKLYKECLKSKIPYIIVPHGSLTKEAQRVKWAKKILGNILLFNRFIKNSQAIQFLSLSEKERTKKIIKKQYIIGNGIDNLNFKNKPSTKKFTFLYIGRYSIFFKGIDIMLIACSEIKEWMKKNNVFIEMYGFGKQKGKIEKLINKYEIRDVCKLNGPIYGEDKRKAMKDANVFIQPSRSEGQPIGIIESLSIGLPCIVTPGTSFYEYVTQKKCGYTCLPNSKSIAEAMKASFYDNINEKSKNAIKNSKIDFSWDNIAQNSIKEYKTITNGNK